MDDLVGLILLNVFYFISIIVIFAVLVYIGKYVFKKVKETAFFKSSRFFNPQEYLPEEELSTIKQVFYLIMIVILVMVLQYSVYRWNSNLFNLYIFDIIISLYLAIHVERTSIKNKFILFLLIPFGSIGGILFPLNFVVILDVFHTFAFPYFIWVYYKKFLEYTEENKLGITIMLLFLIVFISFFITILVEDVSPLNSIAMVSNAFTSNGYAILGDSSIGKLNAIFLVWSGFILSGVGTATLTVAIVMRQVNGKFDYLEELVKRNKKE